MNASSGWYESLNRSPLTPPGWVFRIVWPVLYTLMGVALVLVALRNPPGYIYGIFALQLGMGWVWLYTFFTAHELGLSAWVIVATTLMVVLMVWLFFQESKLAGGLLIPYGVWMCFATYLGLYAYAHNQSI